MSTWTAKAYGIVWTARTFDGLVRMIDRYGEQNNLCAVSIVATEQTVLPPVCGWYREVHNGRFGGY